MLQQFISYGQLMERERNFRVRIMFLHSILINFLNYLAYLYKIYYYAPFHNLSVSGASVTPSPQASVSTIFIFVEN